MFGWTRVFGQSAFALRAMSMAAFGGAILFSAAAARSPVSPKPRSGEGGRRSGRTASLLAAVLVGCSVAFGLQPGATVRPYALLMMFAAMTLWAASRADARQASRRDVLRLFASHLLGLFTHPIFVFLSLASAAAGALFGTRRVRLAATPLAALAIYGVTWGSVLARTAALPATSWMATPAWGDLKAGWLFWGDHATPILGALGIVLIAVRGLRAIRTQASEIAFALLVTTLTLGGAFAISQLKPLFLAARTPVLVLPAASVAVAVVVSELAPLLVACAAAVLLVASAVRFSVRSVEGPDPFPTRASLAAMALRMRCGDTIVAAGLSYAPLVYYASAAGVPSCVGVRAFPGDVRDHPGWLDLTTAARARLNRDADLMAEGLGRQGTIWMFAALNGVGKEAGPPLLEALSRTRAAPESFAVKGTFFDEVTVFPPISVQQAGP